MLAWILASFVFLILLIYILIQVPAVQNFARKKVVSYLENKIHTKVQIAKLSLDFPKKIVLEGVYFEDQKKDTLLYGGKLRVDIALMKLIKSQVEVNYIELQDINAKISRTGNDTLFNYQYIIDAFAGGPSSSTPKDTSGGMKINVDKIIFNNIGASFRDNQTGIDFLVRLGHFQTAFKKFDLDKMAFSLPDIVLENVSGHMYQNKALLVAEPAANVEAESNEPFKLQLGLDNLSFKNIRFVYNNDVSVMSANLNLGELSGKVKSIDLAQLNVQLDKVKLHNTTAAIVLGKSEQTEIVKKEINKETVAQANNPWKIAINDIDFYHNNIAFDDNSVPVLAKGMDFKHLKIDSFTLKADNLLVTPTSYTGNITAGSFEEKSGLNLRQFRTTFAYSDSGAALKNLFVQTDQTIIRDNITVRYPSLEAVTKDMGKLYLDANFVKSNLAAKDILLLAPQLQANLKGNETAIIHVNARIRGYINDLAIPVLQVSGIGNTVVRMSGTIKGLPDPKKASFDFNIGNFQTTKADLNKFLPPGTIPPTIRLPEVMKVSGSFKGLATNFTTNLLLQTSKGNASLKGFLNSASETYDLKGTLNNVDIGYLIKQDTMLGKVTMNYAAKGKGFKPAKMKTNAKAHVTSAFIKGYNYQNLDLTASVNKGYSIINAEMADKSLAFQMKAEALIDDKFATNIKMRLMLDSILLKPLGFATTDLRVHGNIVADIPTADMKAPEGNIQVADLVIFNEGQVYKADSIAITSNNTDTGKVITLNSQIATATLRGNFDLATIATGAMQVIDKYYDLGIKDTALAKNKWNLDATIIPDSLLFVFMPTLAGTDTIRINAQFDGEAEHINLIVNAPKIQLGTQVLDSLTIAAGNRNNGNTFQYAVTVQKAGSKSFQLQRTSLNGSIANNELYAKLNIEDGDGKDKYQLGAKVGQQKGGIRASLSDSLMLDYENWTVDNTNYIQYDSTGVIVHNFSINKSGQSLSINSQSENVTAPVDVVLKNFHIKTLTNLAEQDSLPLDGVINGSVLVKNMMASPIFTSDIRIDTLTFNTDTVGNIIVKVDNETANAYNADVSITGNGNDVNLAGKYYTGESRMDLNLNINNFNLASIRPFTFGALTQADGSLKGAVAVKGTTTDPDLNGSLHFDNANFTPAATGEKLHLSNEAINVSSIYIGFDQFTILDSSGNKAILDGRIFTEDFKTYRFNLQLLADDFQVLNAPKVQNALYYGRLNMDADVKVEGTLTAPKINADLKINKSTDISFVLPSANPEIESRDGVVQFVDVYGGKTDSVFTAITDSLTKFPELAGLDITGTLESDTAAQITLIIDERSGDALKIKGKAALSGGLDKSGKISLTGNYEVQGGSYQLSLSLLKRQFFIQPGSVITWTGDPTSATVDITALYIANTQPVNLLQSELASSSTDVNKYKAKVPFHVLLKMKGELLKPEITFDIELPEDQKSRWTDVEAKLERVRRDDAELNKQVFALLLLGRFVQENPLENSAEGTSLANTAKSSVSRILAEQLNNLAGSLIKGVDLNFGVNSEDDYSSGTRTSRTDLTVGVSKKLLNDRLRVSIGSNFELEGPANTNQSASNIAGDVAVDYLLSKDGKYALRAYRRNRYEGVVEGQVIESGASFIFTFDFNEFKQILNKRTRQQKELDKAEKARRKVEEKADKEKIEAIEEKQKN